MKKITFTAFVFLFLMLTNCTTSQPEEGGYYFENNEFVFNMTVDSLLNFKFTAHSHESGFAYINGRFMNSGKVFLSAASSPYKDVYLIERKSKKKVKVVYVKTGQILFMTKKDKLN